jgi:hypothetical protein
MPDPMVWHTQFSFSRSAADLEDADLRKQIFDAWRLVEMLQEGGRPSAPAYYMWLGHEPALLIAGMLSCMEWTFHRGYDDKEFWKFKKRAEALKETEAGFSYAAPPWFRDPDVCRSHRSALSRLRSDAYGEEVWAGSVSTMPILWPVIKESLTEPAVYELRVAKGDLPDLRRSVLSVPANTKERVVNLQ